MNFDIYILIIIGFYLLLGLLRYALRSFLGLLFWTLYIVGFFFFDEYFDIYKKLTGKAIISLFEFFKALVIISFSYFALYIIILIITSLISRSYYKRRKERMSSGSKVLSKLFSMFFSILQGLVTVVVIIGILAFTVEIMGTNFKVPDEWTRNSYVLKYQNYVFQYFPKQLSSKTEKLEIFLVAMIKKEAREKFTKTTTFDKLLNLPEVKQLSEQISSSPDFKDINIKSISSSPMLKAFMESEKVFDLISSEEFYQAAKQSAGKLHKFTDMSEKEESKFEPDAVITLKNGNQMECRILKEDKQKVYVTSQYGKDLINTEFYRDEIKEVSYLNKSSDEQQ
jgi:hypothetical protein